MRVLAEGLSDLGILPVGVDEAMDPACIFYRRWTLHGFGHMLGLDVHDCATARKERYREGVLEAGYVLTVEPGLYFQPEDELVPAELHGIGVRIEDDVLVTPDRRRRPVRGPAPLRRCRRVLAGHPARGRPPPAGLVQPGALPGQSSQKVSWESMNSSRSSGVRADRCGRVSK